MYAAAEVTVTRLWLPVPKLWGVARVTVTYTSIPATGAGQWGDCHLVVRRAGGDRPFCTLPLSDSIFSHRTQLLRPEVEM